MRIQPRNCIPTGIGNSDAPETLKVMSSDSPRPQSLEKFDLDDRRHERWLPSIRPENGADVLLDRIRAEGFPANPIYETGVEVPVPGVLGVFFSRWPARDGKYGFATSPQYAIRSDHNRYDVDGVIEGIVRLTKGQWCRACRRPTGDGDCDPCVSAAVMIK